MTSDDRRAEDPPFSLAPGGLRLAVRLTPRADRDALNGVGTGADGRRVLLVRLSAPPVEGAANAALIAFVAKSLALRASAVSITSGETARQKLLHLSGDADDLAERVRRWLTAAAAPSERKGGAKRRGKDIDDAAT